MSATVQTINDNVRKQLRDTNASDYIVGSDRLLYKITTQIMDVAGMLDISMAWVSGIVTLATDDYDYALDATQEYASILAVRRASDRVPLEYLTPTVLEAMRQGEVVGSGEPDRYALLAASPATAGVEVVTMLVYPTPSSAENGTTLEALVSYEPSVGVFSDVVPFPERAIRAVELSVMGSCVAEMTDEDLERVKITRDMADRYDTQADRLMKREMSRIYRRHRPDGVIRTQVY